MPEAASVLFGLVSTLHLVFVPVWIGFHGLRRAADFGES